MKTVPKQMHRVKPHGRAKNVTNEPNCSSPAIAVSPDLGMIFARKPLAATETNEATDARLSVVGCPLSGGTCAPPEHAKVETIAATEIVTNEANCQRSVASGQRHVISGRSVRSAASGGRSSVVCCLSLGGA